MILTHFLCLFQAATPAVSPPLWRRAGGQEPGAFILKSPDSRIEFGMDWTLNDGETITGSTWSISQLDPAGGLTVVPDTARIEGALTAVLVEGGVFRRTATLKNRVTTSAGRVLSGSFSMRFGDVEAG